MSNTATTSKPGTGIIGPVRFSYLFVYQPRANKLRPDDEPQYEVTMLIPKEPNEFCPEPGKVKEKVKALMKDAASAKFGDKIPANCASPLKDGDTETNQDGVPRHPGYWYVKAKGGFKPVLIDGYRNPVNEDAGWVSGDWGYVKVGFYGYDQAGNRGVSTGLRAIQFTRKDEPLGNSAEAIANEFDVMGGDSPSGSTEDEFDPFKD